MTKTLLIVIGIVCAVITAAGVMWQHNTFLSRRFKAESELARMVEVLSLLKTNDKQNIPAIREFLKDKSYFVRRQTINALVKLNDRESILEMKKLLNDENETVRHEAEEALKKLGVPAEEIQKAKENK